MFPLEKIKKKRIRDLFSGLLLICAPVIVFATPFPDTWIFQFPAETASNPVLLNLRDLNEKQAGEHSFIKKSDDGNGFVRGDGEPIRFWGVTPRREFLEMPMDSLKKMARFYAKMGMNMVRIHAQISPKGKESKITDVDRTEVDGIRKAVAAFKAEGIYLTISPYWPSAYYLQNVSPNWELTDYEGEVHLWNVLFFNAHLQEGYESWVKTLYTEPNPYTGIPLKDEPAVAIIQIQNEDGMLWWTVDQLRPAQKEILERQFSAFVIKKYGSCTKAAVAWEQAAVEGDRPGDGFLKLFPMWELMQEQTGGKACRVHDQTEFLARLQYDFNRKITDYYQKELGCKQLVNPNNWFTVSMARLNNLERWTYSCADIMAVNRYFTPGHVGENAGWRIDPGHRYVGQSVLYNPASFINNIKQPAGYPCLISEGGWNLPSPHLAEAPFLTAAYQSLTGLDGLLWYTTTSTGYDPNPYLTFVELEDGQYPLRRWTIAIPQMLGLFPANALLYRLGYVSEGETVLTEMFPDSLRFSRNLAWINERSGFDPNRPNMAKLHHQAQTSAINPLVFAAGPVSVSFGEDGESRSRPSTNGNTPHVPGNRIHPELERFIDLEAKKVHSVTGELIWDYGRGVVTLDAPKAQGVCGFDIGEVRLKDVDFTCNNAYASIQIVPLDDKGIAESGKLLLQIGTRGRPTGWQEEAAEFGEEGRRQKGYKILNTGRMPWLLETVDLKVTLRNRVLSEAITLGAAFCKEKDIPVIRNSEGLNFTVPENTMYVLIR